MLNDATVKPSPPPQNSTTPPPAIMPPTDFNFARLLTSHKLFNYHLWFRPMPFKTRMRRLAPLLLVCSLSFYIIISPLLRHSFFSFSSSSPPSSSSPLSSASLLPRLPLPVVDAADLPQDDVLHVVIVASRAHSVSQIQATVRSVADLAPRLHIRIVHEARDADPHVSALAPNYTVLSSRRPYHTALQVADMAVRDVGAPTLVLRAGTRLSAQAPRWLRGARRAYARRPDVAAFALDCVAPLVKRHSHAADHLLRAWSPMQLATNPAFVMRAAPKMSAFLLNSAPPHFQPWPVFSEWLTLRRSDWYHYPAGPGVDDTPLGMSALPERNWTRAPWNVWFSQFLHEYRLGVVYPNLDAALVLYDRPASEPAFAFDHIFAGATDLYAGTSEWQFDPNISVFHGDGLPIAKQYFAEDTIQKIVHAGHEHGGVVSFTMVNNVFIDTARSWLCNVDVAGFRPKGLLWAVTDSESNEQFRQVKGTTTVWLNEVQGGKQTGHQFGNPGYWKLMLERTALITEILARGIAVFAFETDAIWLKDPTPYIDELVDQDADIVGTINTRTEVSGNFFYLRPTLATRRLWHEITAEFSKAYKHAQFEKKTASSWTYIDNDQSLLTKLILRNETWRKAYPLSFLTLDMEKFVDGRWYKPEEGFYTSKRAREPVVINNNFMIGVDEKTERAKKFGHWFWDEKAKLCLDSVVKKAVAQT